MDMKSKKEIRKEILNKRSAMSSLDVNTLSAGICRRLAMTEQYNNAENVCLYMPIKNEADVTLLIDALRRNGRTVWLPRVIGGHMDFYIYNEDTPLISGAFGIREPDSKTVLVPDSRTLVVMPGAVFSVKRGRIGYGGGYYDRFLEENSRCMTAAVCYDFQIIDEVPAEAHDIKPQIIVSEKRIID